MIQKFRSYVHLIIAFISDILSLFGRPLFYQIQFQYFRREIVCSPKNNSLCILGNGPSLKKISDSVEDLKDMDFCAVNLSINNELFYKLKPKMYVIVDMIFWQQPEKENIKLVWENMQKINWDMDVFIPFNASKEILYSFSRNSHIKVHRFSNNPWTPELKYFKKFQMWLYKKGLVSPNCSNVSIGAIYTSVLNGYKDIYLLGVEHSWMRDIKVNNKNEVVLIDRHYYGETEHVWVDYEGKPIKLIDTLASQLSTFSGHLYLREFANYLGDVQIINCTKDSYIDAYKRGNFEELLIKH
ncbi:MAG: hypothetical protein MSG77_07200 [Prevotella sp.]|nr:hypothetical protein [Prevotella sp.]